MFDDDHWLLSLQASSKQENIKLSRSKLRVVFIESLSLVKLQQKKIVLYKCDVSNGEKVVSFLSSWSKKKVYCTKWRINKLRTAEETVIPITYLYKCLFLFHESFSWLQNDLLYGFIITYKACNIKVN